MLDLVKGEAERIDSCFLDLACGSGNFLVAVLRCTLAAVSLTYGTSDFERQHYALLALMCIYGIELLRDNSAECRANLLEIFAEYLDLIWWSRTTSIAPRCMCCRKTLCMATRLQCAATTGSLSPLPSGNYLGKGTFQRRDFRLTMRAHRHCSAQRVVVCPPDAARAVHADESLPADDCERTGYCLVRYCREGGQIRDWAVFTLHECTPDMLPCIANLSNDEVFTVPKFLEGHMQFDVIRRETCKTI